MAILDLALFDDSLFDELPSVDASAFVAPRAAVSGSGSVTTSGTGAISAPLSRIRGTGNGFTGDTPGEWDGSLFDEILWDGDPATPNVGNLVSPVPGLVGSGSLGVIGAGAFLAPSAKLDGTGSTTSPGDFTTPRSALSGTGSVGSLGAAAGTVQLTGIATPIVGFSAAVNGAFLLTGSATAVLGSASSATGELDLTGSASPVLGYSASAVGDIVFGGDAEVDLGAVPIECITSNALPMLSATLDAGFAY